MTANGTSKYFTTLSLNHKELKSLESLSRDFFNEFYEEVEGVTENQMRFTLDNLINIAEKKRKKIIKMMIKEKL